MPDNTIPNASPCWDASRHPAPAVSFDWPFIACAGWVAASLFAGAAACSVSYVMRLAKAIRRETRVTREQRDALEEGRQNHDVDSGAWLWNVVTNSMQWDSRLAGTLGYPPGAPLTAEWWGDHIHPDDRPEVFAVLEAHLRGESEAFGVDCRFLTDDGAWRWHHINGRTMARDASGAPLLVSGIQSCVTERKAIEDALARREKTLQALVFAAEALLRGDTWEDHITEALARLGRSSGVSRVSVFSRCEDESDVWAVLRHEWLDPDEQEKPGWEVSGLGKAMSGPSAWLRDALEAGRTLALPEDVDDEHDQAWLEEMGLKNAIITPIHVGEDWWGFLSCEDTRRERVWPPGERDAMRAAAMLFGAALQGSRIRQALHATHKRYRDVLDNLPIGLFRTTSSQGGRFVMVNPALVSMLGYETAEKLMRTPVVSFYEKPEDRYQLNTRLLRGAQVQGLEMRFRRKNGALVWCSLTARVLHDETTGEDFFDGVIEDITLRKVMEQTLSENEETFRAMTASALDAIVMLDQSGCITYWNEAAARIFGFASTEVHGRPIVDMMIPPALKLTFWRMLKRFRRSGRKAFSGRAIEAMALRRDQVEIPVELAVSSVRLRGQWHALAIIRDITERKETARLLATKAGELERANQLLWEALEKTRRLQRVAESASKAKSQFLANISHELRTPMNGVLGMTDLLMRTGMALEQQGLVEQIQRSGESLLLLINDLLDLAKIEAGHMEINTAIFDLERVIVDAARLVSPAAQAKNLPIAIWYPPGMPDKYAGDPHRIAQVLVNLMGNAVKFTDEGHVAILASWVPGVDQRDRIAIHVVDTGPGLNDDQKSIIFRDFAQAFDSSRQYGGTGLGLAICQALARLMGGAISVASAPGKGSRFTLSLSLRPAPRDEMAPRLHQASHVTVADPSPARRQCITRSLREMGVKRVIQTGALTLPEPTRLLLVSGDLLQRSHGLWPVPPDVPVLALTSMGRALPSGTPPPGTAWACCAAPFTNAELSGRILHLLHPNSPEYAPSLQADAEARILLNGEPVRVLLVEDDPISETVASGLLQSLGCQVHTARDGAKGLAAWKSGVYDIVFMDVRMPVMDGVTATRAIREHERLRDGVRMPIVALTANTMRQDIEACLEAGMDAAVAKPLRIEMLLHAIQRCLPIQITGPRSAILRRLLAVESDPEILHSLMDAMRQVFPDLTIQGASNAIEAHIAIGAFSPTLIIASHDVPSLDIPALAAYLGSERRKTRIIVWRGEPGEIEHIGGVLFAHGRPSTVDVITLAASLSGQEEPPLVISQPSPMAGIRSGTIDMDVARKTSGGNPKRLETLFNLLGQALPERIQLLREALSADDAYSAIRHAHTLKGQALNIGARNLEETASRIENSLKKGAFPIRSVMEELEAIAAEVLSAIQLIRKEAME